MYSLLRVGAYANPFVWIRLDQLFSLFDKQKARRFPPLDNRVHPTQNDHHDLIGSLTNEEVQGSELPWCIVRVVDQRIQRTLHFAPTVERSCKQMLPRQPVGHQRSPMKNALDFPMVMRFVVLYSDRL